MIPKPEYFNILSLDGGGIKGLYAARVLEIFEREYNCNLSQCFDLICGTSTGGLIALSIASSRSAKEIADFYEEKGSKIFPHSNLITRKIAYYKSILFSSKYSNKALKEEATKFFGNTLTMKDLKTNVNIPAYNVVKGTPVIFKKSENENFIYDQDVKLIDVALATSAAPTYFPIHQIKNTKYRDGHYVDGGIWANDPSITGLLEAIKYLNISKKTIRILSISAVPTSPETTVNNNTRYSARNWGKTLFDFIFQSQLHQNKLIMDWLSDELNIEYIRIEPEELQKDQLQYIEMDLANQKAYRLYNRLAKASAEKAMDNHKINLENIFKL